MIAELLTPLSDVMNNAVPYVLILVLNGNTGDGPLRVSVRLMRTSPPTEQALEKSIELALSDASGEHRVQITVAADMLGPGEYAGEVRLIDEDDGIPRQFSFYRMPELAPAPVPFGIYAFPVPETTESKDAMFREWQEAGIDLITGHMHELDGLTAFYDRSARFGMTFRPSMRFWSPDAGKDWHRAFLGKTNGGEPRGKGICLIRSELREQARANVTRNLQSYRRHPAFSGSVYFGDDLFLASHFAEGQADIGCYCDDCVSAYRALTGEEPPQSTDLLRGPVPEDHPWLRWNRFRCDRQYADFLRTIMDAKDAVDPDIAIGPIHGPPDNPFNQLGTGLYGPRTQVMDAVSSYAYTFLRSPASDFILHYELGRMSHRDKPVWMLGFLEGDNTVAPPWHVTQSYWNMLAAGYRTIAFFSWWGVPKHQASASADVRRRMRESIAALSRCGDHKDWIFSVAAHWKRPTTRYAQLYSFTTEASDISPVWRHHTHAKRVGRLYRQALAQQVELDLISEEEVLAGILDNYDTVLLHDVRALRGDVVTLIDEYSARDEKRVLLDQDLLYNDGWHPQVRLRIRQSVELTPESMINLLDRESGPRIRCDNPDATLRRFTAGAIDYLVLVNNDPDRVVGMPYSYGDPPENYKHADLVPNEPIDATLTFSKPDQWLFDAETGAALGTSDEPLRIHLDPAWGQVITILPCPEAQIAVDLPGTATGGETVTGHIAMLDDHGSPLRGAFTVHITITRPDGGHSQYSQFAAIEAGVLDVDIPFGANEPAGRWLVAVSGGFPRRTVTCEVQLTAPEKVPDFATLSSLP